VEGHPRLRTQVRSAQFTAPGEVRLGEMAPGPPTLQRDRLLEARATWARDAIPWRESSPLPWVTRPAGRDAGWRPVVDTPTPYPPEKRNFVRGLVRCPTRGRAYEGWIRNLPHPHDRRGPLHLRGPMHVAHGDDRVPRSRPRLLNDPHKQQGGRWSPASDSPLDLGWPNDIPPGPAWTSYMAALNAGSSAASKRPEPTQGTEPMKVVRGV